MNINKRFGVYALPIKNNQVLCIKKTRGPYINRYDLPGGSQIEGESLIETLKREFTEETGMSIKNPKVFFPFDLFLIDIEDRQNMLHHIAIVYKADIDTKNDNHRILKELHDGTNDSNGAKWIAMDSININNASPILVEALEYFKTGIVKEKIEYYDWQTYSGN